MMLYGCTHMATVSVKGLNVDVGDGRTDRQTDGRTDDAIAESSRHIHI